VRAESGAATHAIVLPRVTLRPVGPGDLDFLLAHWGDPQVRRFLFDATPAEPEESAEAVAGSVRDFATVGYGLWIILHTERAERIGTVGLRPLDDVGIEVFYSLTPGAWGHGYATEAARGVVYHALYAVGLNEVFAEVDEGNTASAAVVERVGMTAVDVVPGVLGPVIRYRKTRPDQS
jgi:[ribosomal protein S5]-alanine N-acetyltransferase